jgi:RNase P subunit RPR2
VKKHISKSQAKDLIDKFFSRNNFAAEQLKKMRKLAMRHKIKLSKQRKFFCKSCLSKLSGKIRITGTHKTVICKSCGFKNKFKLS